MASADDRVVHMEFDNKAFEKNVNATISSLGSLEKALKMEGVKKALTDLSKTAKDINIAEGVSQGIEGLNKKFLAMSAIGISAINNVVTSFMGAGTRLVKSLSFDNLTSGFQEYETNIGSIQTILANTDRFGTKLPEVTASLDELNEYSDKTIYNFGEMVKNIGLFTNAGIKIKDATSMIKGFSNVAAASGTSAEGAAGAAYQLSQALSTGKVTLMDWKSLTNVGMGNKNMQDSLIQIADAMGTVNDKGLTAKEIQTNFNGSLQEGWLSADVMSTYLKIMAGDMTEAEQAALGLSKGQIAAFKRSQGIAQDAATKVRTITALMGTLRESIGSGFSESFRLVIGDFTQATRFLTPLSNIFTGIVGRSAEARNKVLMQWQKAGGRNNLIQGIFGVLMDLKGVIDPVKKAFRDVFPRKTGKELADLTKGFFKFIRALIPGEKTMKAIAFVLKGVFSILKIGQTILFSAIRLFYRLTSTLLGLIGGSGIGTLAEKFGTFFFNLQKGLVDGKGIEKFFGGLEDLLLKPIKILGDLIAKIKEFFGSLDFKKTGKDAQKGLAKVGDSLSIFDRVVDRLQMFGRGLQTLFEGFQDVMDKIWSAVAAFFGGLIGKIADVMGESDFDAALDVLNTGLLAGITAILYKFVRNGFKFDVGNGFFEKIGNTFKELQKTLKTFQAKIKADALFRIAEAIALITAAVVVLSLIDSAALTKALAAMSVGFGQLLATFALIEKIGSSSTVSAGQFALISGGFVLLAGAMLILAGAAFILSRLSWQEIAKGMTAVTGLMGALVGSLKLMGDSSEDAIKAGVGLGIIAGSMLILAAAVKIFSMMSMQEIGQGIVTIAGGLLVMVEAMKRVPDDLSGKGRGILEVGIALNLLAFAVKKFAGLSWGEIAKGLGSIAVGLRAITSSMGNIAGAKMAEVGKNILIVSVALLVMSKAVEMMGSLDLTTLAKGIGGLAAILLVLETASAGMSTTAGAAGAMVLLSVALIGMSIAVERFAGVPFGDLLKGVASIALVIAVMAGIGIAAEAAILPLAGLGGALFLIGAGLFLFGAAAFLAGKAFESFAKSGADGAEHVLEALKTVGKALPAFFIGFAEGIIEFLKTLAEFAPQITESIIKLVTQLLDGFASIIPKMGGIISLIIDQILIIIGEKIPEIEEAAIQLVLALLNGLAENVDDVVNAALNILDVFLDTLAEHVPQTVTRATNTFISILQSIAFNLGRIAATLMGGLALKFIQGFVQGMTDNMHMIQDIWNMLPKRITGWIGNVAKTLVGKGKDILTGFINGVKSVFDGPGNKVKNFFLNFGKTIVGWITAPMRMLYNVGKDVIEGFKNGIKAVWHSVEDWIDDKLSHLPGPIKKVLGIHSPSTVFAEIGRNVIAGFVVGLNDDAALTSASEQLGDHAKKNLMAAFSSLSDSLGTMDEFNPVITPVLDLSAVRTDASKIAGYIQANSIMVPTSTTAQAQLIASSTVGGSSEDTSSVSSGDGDVVFNQTINSRERLSTADIYRQTRNQIATAKEDLKIKTGAPV